MTPQIVTIGGGTGAPAVIKSLIKAGFSNISAVSAASDNGGRSGMVRTDERDQVISVGDLFKTLLALIPENKANSPQIKAFTDLVNFTDGRNRNLGYSIYYALLEKYDGKFVAIQRHLEQLLNLKFVGTAIPVSLKPAHLQFVTQTGSRHFGEHELDRLAMSTDKVVSISLDRPVKATIQAQNAIKQATHIIYCPGSVYGSVLSNFLPQGIIQALRQSHSQKILITNLVSDRNQTHQISLLEYLGLFKKYSRLKNPVDIIICPDLTTSQFTQKYPRTVRNYATSHSYFLGWDPSEKHQIQKSGVACLSSNIYTITSRHRLRHDPDKLAKVLKSIII